MPAVAVNHCTRTCTYMYMLLVLPIINEHVVRKTSYIESFQRTRPGWGCKWYLLNDLWMTGKGWARTVDRAWAFYNQPESRLHSTSTVHWGEGDPDFSDSIFSGRIHRAAMGFSW